MRLMARSSPFQGGGPGSIPGSATHQRLTPVAQRTELGATNAGVQVRFLVGVLAGAQQAPTSRCSRGPAARAAPCRGDDRGFESRRERWFPHAGCGGTSSDVRETATHPLRERKTPRSTRGHPTTPHEPAAAQAEQYVRWRVRLAWQDIGFSLRRSRVHIPYALPPRGRPRPPRQGCQALTAARPVETREWPGSTPGAATSRSV